MGCRPEAGCDAPLRVDNKASEAYCSGSACQADQSFVLRGAAEAQAVRRGQFVAVVTEKGEMMQAITIPAVVEHLQRLSADTLVVVCDCVS